MRKLIILSSALSLTGCATVDNQASNTNTKQLVTSLLIIGAVAYVANETADKNRNKQCQNNKKIYQGLGTQRYYICP